MQVGTTFGPVGITSASGNSPSEAYPGPSPEMTPEREEISGCRQDGFSAGKADLFRFSLRSQSGGRAT